MKDNILIKLAPLLFLFMWSSGAVFAKVGLQYTDAWSFLFIRTSIALALLSIIGYFNSSKPRSIHSIEVREIAVILCSGLLLQVCYLVCYLFAIQTQMSLGVIILILGLQPILTLILDIKYATFKQFLLLSVCFLGLLLSLFGYYELKALNLLGVLFTIGALLSMTAGTIIQSKTNSHPLFMLWLQTFLAWWIFAVMVLINGFYIQYHWQFVLASLWMGGVVSVGAILLLMMMLKHRSVSKVSSLFFMLPILTIFLDSWIFSTGLSWLSIIGAVIVCGSLWMFQKLP